MVKLCKQNQKNIAHIRQQRRTGAARDYAQFADTYGVFILNRKSYQFDRYATFYQREVRIF